MKSFQATALVAMTAFGLAAAQSNIFTSIGNNETTTTSSRISATSRSSRTSTTGIPASTPSSGNGTTGSTPSMNLFIDGPAGGGYAASIVEACGDQTVYAIRCTSGPASYAPSTCGAAAPVVTVTENPSSLLINYITHGIVYGVDATATVTESCDLQGTTAAACHLTVFASADGQKTSTAVSTSLTGAAYHRYDVAITAGAENTASATGKCTSGATYAADSRGVLAMAGVGALSLAAILAL